MSLTVEKCIQAWTNSLRQMNSKADIVFFGDSLTYYGDFSSVFPDKVVCNLGLRGDTIQGMIDRVNQVIMLEPKYVFIMAGINDVTSLSIKSFKKKYLLLIETLLKGLSGSKFYIQNILPVNSTDFDVSCNNEHIEICNRCIKEIANDKQLFYVDLFSDYLDLNGFQLSNKFTIDGIHLQRSAYCRWYKKIAEII